MILTEEHYSEFQKLLDKIEDDINLLRRLQEVCCKDVLDIGDVMKIVNGEGLTFYDFEDLAVSDMVKEFVTSQTKYRRKSSKGVEQSGCKV